jgi:hypothetical protein
MYSNSSQKHVGRCRWLLEAGAEDSTLGPMDKSPRKMTSATCIAEGLSRGRQLDDRAASTTQTTGATETYDKERRSVGSRVVVRAKQMMVNDSTPCRDVGAMVYPVYSNLKFLRVCNKACDLTSSGRSW